MPSIHPSILICLSGAGSWWQPAKQGPPGFLLPSHTLVPPGGSRGVPRPDEIYNPSSGFWVCPGVSSQLDVPGKPLRGGAGGPEPPQLTPFDAEEKRLDFEFPPDV